MKDRIQVVFIAGMDVTILLLSINNRCTPDHVLHYVCTALCL